MKKGREEEALRWLAQAEAELEDATNLTKAGRYYLSLYLCQQSAEKALKAFMYSKKEEALFTHSIAVLLKIAASIDSEFGSLKAAKRLDDYYISTRYPNGLPGAIPSEYYDDPEEAEQALEWSGKIIALVRKKVRRTGF